MKLPVSAFSFAHNLIHSDKRGHWEFQFHGFGSFFRSVFQFLGFVDHWGL